MDINRMAVTLYIGMRKFGRRLHNLVAHAFIPNPEHKECVYNANNDVTNCRADNLYWISELERTRMWGHQLNRKLMLEQLKSHTPVVV